MKRKVHLVCDDCGMEIADPCDGELDWAWRDEAKERVPVVHAPYACPRWKHRGSGRPRRGSERLDFFLGRLGLLDLLARIESKELPLETGLELIRRLHVPGYEQYRLFRRKHNASGSDSKLPGKPDRRDYRKYLALKTESLHGESGE
jgi:hypothetical protein